MTKTELITNVANNVDCSKNEVTTIINATFEVIMEALSKKDNISISGFGSFVVQDRAAHKGRNPATGEEMFIPAKRMVRFKAGKHLRDIVAK